MSNLALSQKLDWPDLLVALKDLELNNETGSGMCWRTLIALTNELTEPACTHRPHALITLLSAEWVGLLVG